jgi:hypothetical protein
MAINPTLAARRKKTAKDTEAIHEKTSLVSKSSMHPGKKCLYSWTCGPRSDAYCPYAYFCEDWRKPLIPCSRCAFGEPRYDEDGTPFFACTREKRKNVRMPKDGYCSEGMLDRFQDAARYL